MKIEIYAGNNLEGTCENTMSEELWKLFWKAVDEKEDIVIYYGDIADIQFCECDDMWDVFIHNNNNEDWGDGGYEDSSYNKIDLYIPINATENYIKNGWS